MWIETTDETESLLIDLSKVKYIVYLDGRSLRFYSHNEHYKVMRYVDAATRQSEYNRIKDLLLKTNRVNPVTGE